MRLGLPWIVFVLAACRARPGVPTHFDGPDAGPPLLPIERPIARMLFAQADDVFVGRVLEVEPNPTHGRTYEERAYQHVDLEVVRTFQGTAAGIVTVGFFRADRPPLLQDGELNADVVRRGVPLIVLDTSEPDGRRHEIRTVSDTAELEAMVRTLSLEPSVRWPSTTLGAHSP